MHSELAAVIEAAVTEKLERPEAKRVWESSLPGVPLSRSGSVDSGRFDSPKGHLL